MKSNAQHYYPQFWRERSIINKLGDCCVSSAQAVVHRRSWYYGSYESLSILEYNLESWVSGGLRTWNSHIAKKKRGTHQRIRRIEKTVGGGEDEDRKDSLWLWWRCGLIKLGIWAIQGIVHGASLRFCLEAKLWKSRWQTCDRTIQKQPSCPL